MQLRVPPHSASTLGVVLCLLVSGFFHLKIYAQQLQPAQQPDRVARDAWHKSMKKTPLPRHGCFMATYPSTEWQETKCTAAPNIPFAPKVGSAPQTVGDGNDFVAQATSGLISSSEGSFPNSGGVASESGYVGGTPPAAANSFSLQLNSNYFYNAPQCSGAANPSLCQGWQQFIFAEGNSGSGAVFIQYWLLDYGTACPPNWTESSIPGETNCWMNSTSSTYTPPMQASDIPYMTLSGSTANGTDTAIFDQYSGGTIYSLAQSNVLNLDQNWTGAEFNVFGDAGGSEANFNNGSTFVVQTSVTNGTSNMPQCLGPQGAGAGTTAETNNLSLIPQTAPLCCPYSASSPYIQFLESNATGATASCGANGLVSNISPPPYATNGSEKIITYPIIQGEIRIEYSATLEYVGSEGAITYQFLNSCDASLGSATVDSGSTVGYVNAEIDGQPCTYGFHGTMSATAPGYVPSPYTGIIF